MYWAVCRARNGEVGGLQLHEAVEGELGVVDALFVVPGRL
jgi:hypothetical protein